MQTPVAVCMDAPHFPIVYFNAAARLLLNPLLRTPDKNHGNLEDWLTPSCSGNIDVFFEQLRNTGAVSRFKMTLVNFENMPVPVFITANRAEIDGTVYFVFYLVGSTQSSVGLPLQGAAEIITEVLRLSQGPAGAEETIDQVLAFVGSYIGVSRVYIFEEISPANTRNTYEWCSHDITPVIHDLQNLPKEAYPYDIIISQGLYITNDIRELADKDKKTLEKQGIKSLAIFALTYQGKALGYVGFDDCNQYRSWSSAEIGMLKNIAAILSSLLLRRDHEKKTARSMDILTAISDNIDNIIYVTDLKTYELIFANKATIESTGRDMDDMLGKPCWQVIQHNQNGICPFCPLRKMLDETGNTVYSHYVWEFQNTITGKWYLIRDSIIPWVDGRVVHIETATEITFQKKYELQLEQYAAYDMMTGVYNREWGTRIIRDRVATNLLSSGASCLVFIDIDGLKRVNDKHGHDVGDDMIIQTARTIRGCVRKSDVLCRWGGDEFVLLLECDESSAVRVMQNVESKMALLNETTSLLYNLSISYGITALDTEETLSVEAIIGEADRKMYHNKSGRPPSQE